MDSEKLAELAADACDDRKAVNIQLIRVDEVSSLADWMVIAGGQSDVQVRAIARSVEDRLEDEVRQRLAPWLADYRDFPSRTIPASSRSRDEEEHEMESLPVHSTSSLHCILQCAA